MEWFSIVAMQCVLQTAGTQEVLSDAETLALMVGCMCHDLDHRGTNNAFQAKYAPTAIELKTFVIMV